MNVTGLFWFARLELPLEGYTVPIASKGVEGN